MTGLRRIGHTKIDPRTRRSIAMLAQEGDLIFGDGLSVDGTITGIGGGSLITIELADPSGLIKTDGLAIDPKDSGGMAIDTDGLYIVLDTPAHGLHMSLASGGLSIDDDYVFNTGDVINGELEILSTTTPQFTITNNGANDTTFAVGATGDLTITPSGNNVICTGTLEILEASHASQVQLELSYNGSNNTTFAVGATGDLTITPSGTTVNIAATVDLGGDGITANVGDFQTLFVDVIIDLGVNTIADGDMTGDWDFGSGDLTTTETGTFGNVVATTRVTAGLEIGIGKANPDNSLDIVQRVPTIRQECVRDQPGDGALAYEMFKAIVTNDTTSINAGRIGNFGDVNLGATPSMRYIYIDADTTAAFNSAMLKIGKNGVGIGISGSTIPGYTLDMDGHLRMRGDNNYLSIGATITDLRLTSDGTNGIIDVANALRMGNITTNYCEVDNVGNVTLVGTGRTLETPKIKLTAIGGYAIRMTNKTGGNTVEGQIVGVSAGTDNAFETADADYLHPIGVVLDAGVADASEAWVVVSGIAEVLADSVGFSRQDRLITGGVGEEGTATVGNLPTAAEHFQEIGHALEGAGAGVLGKCVIHFL